MKVGKPWCSSATTRGEDLWERNQRKKTLYDESYERIRAAHFSILHRLKVAVPYIQQHFQYLRQENEDHLHNWIMKEHKCCFETWLKDQNQLVHGRTQENMISNIPVSVGPHISINRHRYPMPPSNVILHADIICVRHCYVVSSVRLCHGRAS
jgi:hypothetical protein